MPKLIRNWKELLAIPPNDKYKIVDRDGYGYNAWIEPIEKTEETEKNWSKHYIYLSTHTFYGKTYKYSTRVLQEHGFDVEIDNWDKEEEDKNELIQ